MATDQQQFFETLSQLLGQDGQDPFGGPPLPNAPDPFGRPDPFGGPPFPDAPDPFGGPPLPEEPDPFDQEVIQVLREAFSGSKTKRRKRPLKFIKQILQEAFSGSRIERVKKRLNQADYHRLLQRPSQR